MLIWMQRHVAFLCQLKLSLNLKFRTEVIQRLKKLRLFDIIGFNGYLN